MEDQVRGQTRSHPSDEDDFLWETRFLKPPRYCLHFLFFLCRWILRQSKGSTISSRFTFRVDICYPPMRSVKQTTTNCFSFHFKNFPSFLFFFLSFELKAGPREGRFLIAKETLEMFFGSNTFSLPVSATYVQRLGEVERARSFVPDVSRSRG